jgi:ABC-2 type transport system ATP-binding protein
VINASDVAFSYDQKTPVLKSVDLNISRGSIFGLIGPNGAGKSTLISLLTGINEPQQGTININGLNYEQDRSRILQKLSMVPQEYAFYPQLTVRENLDFFSSLYLAGIKNRKSSIKAAVKMTGLDSHQNRLAKHFSGGLKRRLNLAIGLLNKPDLLILDEPTVGIDPQSRHFILEAIKSLNTQGTTILYTSHYMEEIEQLCDSIAIIDHGTILTVGSLETLLSKKTYIQIKTDRDISQYIETLAPFFENGSLKAIKNKFEAVLKEAQILPVLMKNIISNGYRISRVEFGSQTLESLFFNLTQTALRD